MTSGADQVGEAGFKWTLWEEEGYIDLVERLGNTERDQLRQLAGEGGPLWTIQQSMVSYARALERAITQCDFTSASGIQRASALQGELRAVIWQREMWERALTPKPEVKEKE